MFKINVIKGDILFEKFCASFKREVHVLPMINMVNKM